MDKKVYFLINQFKLSEDDAERIISFCKRNHADKYSVWVAKEFKKNEKILNNPQEITYILDWVIKKKINILKYDFDTAFENSKKWHEENFKITKNKNENNKEGDSSIIYRCKDKKHYFKILTPKELPGEGEMMGNCIGGYGHKIQSGKSIIISLRDEKNMPHVDIEIDAKTGESLQVRGKQNLDPVKKYKNFIIEYVLHIMGEDVDIDNEIKEIIINSLK